MHADEPSDQAAEQSSATLFPDHPLGRDVLGTEESISAVTADQIRHFFEHHYRPGNMVAAVAGDLDHDQVVAGLEERSSGVTGGERPERLAPDQSVEPLRVTRRPTEQAQVILGMRSVDRFDPRRYALALLNHVLGGGLVQPAVPGDPGAPGSGLLGVVRPDGLPGRGSGQRRSGHRPRARRRGAGHRHRPAREPGRVRASPPRELAIAKGNLRAEMLLASEDSGARMSRIGSSLLLHGQVLEVDEILARVEAVTLDDVAQAAADLAAAPRTLSVVGPFDEARLRQPWPWASADPGPGGRLPGCRPVPAVG